MRINEIILEEQLDELSLSGIGNGIKTVATKTAQVGADVVAGTAGGLSGAWSRAKRAYRRGQAAVDPEKYGNQQSTQLTADQLAQLQRGVPFDQLNPPVAQPTQDAPVPNRHNTTAGTQATTTQPTSSANTGNEINQILQSIAPLDTASKQEIIKRIQAEPATNTQNNNQAEPAPTSTGDRMTQMKADAAAKKKAEADLARQQMANTQQANQASAAQDNATVAKVKAIQDKQKRGELVSQDEILTLKKAAQSGIHENDEFYSRFLGIVI